MKLRNKKTGEWCNFTMTPTEVFSSTPYYKYHYNSLAELNEEWEDYEEPKDYWCIDWRTGGINHITVLDAVDEYEENKKEIGNYFETKEEAEKAVEKLKAWKRLKDKGIKFKKEMFYGGHEYSITACYDDDYAEDLDLLFGGEE